MTQHGRPQRDPARIGNGWGEPATGDGQAGPWREEGEKGSMGAKDLIIGRRAARSALDEFSLSWESDEVVVPLRPGNAGGGKDPWFGTRAESGKGWGQWAT
jgi:hypothetical protein